MNMQRRTATRVMQRQAAFWLCLMCLVGNPLAQTATISFDLDGFTEISVSSVFNVAVTQGEDFLVEVTIDENEVDSVDVTQTGNRLDISLLPGMVRTIETIEALFTLPVLNSIVLDGVIKATLSGFNQTQCRIDVAGVSQLSGDSLVISDLIASVSGVSELDFSDISPLETASISVIGVSKATLNMNIGSSLTGSVSGIAQLFYYGTNVAVSVETDTPSTLIRLGDTRKGEFSERLYFAQFGNGQGFTSDVVLSNLSSSKTASGKATFLDNNGFPMPVGITADSVSGVPPAIGVLTSQLDQVDFLIPPLGAVTISTDGQGDLAVGSAVVRSDHTLGGIIRFRIPGIGIAGVGSSPPLSRFIVPVRRVGAINTGIAIHNTKGTPVTLTLTLRISGGTISPAGRALPLTEAVAPATIEELAANGHLALFLDELFPDTNTDDFNGTLVVEVTDGQVAATALDRSYPES